MTGFQNALSSPRLNRMLLWFSALVLAAGVALVVNNLAGGSDGAKHDADPGFRPTLPAKVNPLKTATGAKVKDFEQLDPQMKSTIRTFLATAVSRKDLGRSWDVIAPSMKSGYTRAEWTNADELPVVPYPIDDVDRASYDIFDATTQEVLVDVGLSAERRSQRPRRFRLGLSPVGAGADKRWLVSYWMPLWTPIVPLN